MMVCWFVVTSVAELSVMIFCLSLSEGYKLAYSTIYNKVLDSYHYSLSVTAVAQSMTTYGFIDIRPVVTCRIYINLLLHH